jgi:hypothetical protein
MGLLLQLARLVTFLALAQNLMMTLQRLVREAGANLADRLIRLRLVVEAREMERAVDSRAFACTEIGADDD